MSIVRVGDLVAAPDKKNTGYVVEEIEGTWATVRDGGKLRTFSTYTLRVIGRKTIGEEATA